MLQATHDITDKLPLDKSVEGVVLQNETEIAKLSLARQESGGKRYIGFKNLFDQKL